MIPKTYSKKEFVPRRWEGPRPFKKYVKVILPVFSRDELQILLKFLTEDLQKGEAKLSPDFLINFSSTNKFHQYIRNEYTILNFLKIPYEKIPLEIGKEIQSPSRWERVWFNAILRWRLMIGR